MANQEARLRRAKKTRAKIKELGNIARLTVHRSSKHIYAQVIDQEGKVLAASIVGGANIAAAKEVGKDIAAKGIKAGVKKVAFDRSGFRYHGRIRALAEAAREGSLEF